MLSQPISDCGQSDTKRFAVPANAFATQPVRPQIQQDLVGPSSVIQTVSPQYSGNIGFKCVQPPYPLRS